MVQKIETQSADKREQSNVREVAIFDHNTKPSWKRYGQGTSSIKVGAALDRSWISFYLEEHAKPANPDGRWTSRACSFTADREGALAIYDMLRLAFGDFGDRPVIELEISARKRPHETIEIEATSSDKVGVIYRPHFCEGDRFAYFHNGIRITRERAVELLI